MERRFCPFYGFSWPEGTAHLADKGDDRCGLVFDRVEICLMERERTPVDYRRCPVYLEKEPLLAIGSPYIVLHPREIPDGIRLEEWKTRLLSRQPAC
jgi:hypothetical protein